MSNKIEIYQVGDFSKSLVVTGDTVLQALNNLVAAINVMKVTQGNAGS